MGAMREDETMLKEAENRVDMRKEMEELWEERFEQLRRRAWRTGLLNSEDEVEDVLQEAAVSILERLNAGADIRNMKAYAGQTVYSKACDLRRGEMDAHDIPIEKAPATETADRASQERDADLGSGVFEERRKGFWEEVFADLCPADRTVLGLRLGGCEPGEIATMLGRTTGAVYASNYRIDRAMRKIAERQGIKHEDDLFGPDLPPRRSTGGGWWKSQGMSSMSDSSGPGVFKSEAVAAEGTASEADGRDGDD